MAKREQEEDLGVGAIMETGRIAGPHMGEVGHKPNWPRKDVTVIAVAVLMAMYWIMFRGC